MRITILRSGALALVCSLALSGSAVAEVTRADRQKARSATRFLSAEQRRSGAIVAFSKIGSTADAVVALVAARREPRTIKRALRFLGNHSAGVDTIGEIAKVHMALVAAGKDPVIGERNLTEELKAAQQADGAYGDTSTFDQVYGHTLAMLALASAGEPTDGQAVQWLRDAQCADGGWQYDLPSGDSDDLHCNNGTDADFTQTDSNTTAQAVLALAAVTGQAPLATDPFAFFELVRDEIKGGWGYTHGFTLTDANSTALVIQAHAAEERTLPAGAKRALRKLQYNVCSKKKGAFAYSWSDANGDGRFTKRERTGPDVGATIAGIMGLLEKPLPIEPREVTKEQPKPVCGAPLN